MFLLPYRTILYRKIINIIQDSYYYYAGQLLILYRTVTTTIQDNYNYYKGQFIVDSSHFPARNFFFKFCFSIRDLGRIFKHFEHNFCPAWLRLKLDTKMGLTP